MALVDPPADASASQDASKAQDAPEVQNDASGSPADAPQIPARCDLTKPFGEATLVPGINSAFDEMRFSLTGDEKTAFVARSKGNGNGLDSLILAARRESRDVPFGAPDDALTSTINQLNSTTGTVYNVAVSADGLTLYTSRSSAAIAISTRPGLDATFGAESLVTIQDDDLSHDAYDATISADGQTLYWEDTSFSQIFAASRVGQGAFDNQKLIADAQAPIALSADELSMFSALGIRTVLVATRPDKAAMFGANSAIPNVSSSSNDFPVALTVDGCVLYISSNRPEGLGGYDIWEAHRSQ
jgi:hypothetical protein